MPPYNKCVTTYLPRLQDLKMDGAKSAAETLDCKSTGFAMVGRRLGWTEAGL